MTKVAYFILSVLAFSYCSDAYKILIVSPLKGKSHAILAEGLIKHLVKAGHEITYVAGFPPDKPIPNVKVVECVYTFGKDIEDSLLSLKSHLSRKTSLMDLIDMFNALAHIVDTVILDENVQTLLNDKTQHFDVAIIEWLFSDLYASFAAVFDCPFIWFSSVEPHHKILRLIDESTNPAYTADSSSSNIPPFTFTQRLAELGFQILGRALDYIYFEGSEKEIYEKNISPIIRSRGRSVPDFNDVKYNASLVLGNSHVSLGMANKLPDSYKHIGGYHIDREVKPLPENLKKLFDNAAHGVIYFSMGSNLKSKTLPDELKRDLLAMFGKLKQTVLWKFEEDLPNRPANVHIVQWAPQQSILAHEKCLIFITHGGLLSTTETIHFGVPTIGIPVFADQFINVARAVQKGFARKVDLSYTMADKLYEEINEVLTNPIYRQKVKELSQIYHDRPTTPDKEMVHWVEHVVRTRGAPHLRSPALMVPWYQKAYLDLLAVILVVVLLIKKSICCLIKSLRSKKQLSKEKKNKEKKRN